MIINLYFKTIKTLKNVPQERKDPVLVYYCIDWRSIDWRKKIKKIKDSLEENSKSTIWQKTFRGSFLVKSKKKF
jgi:hypothetical protein